MKFFLFFLAIIPGLLICYYIYKLDRYDHEPRKILAVNFFAGVLLTIPVFKLEQWAITTGFADSGHWLAILVVAFVVVALCEELFKFLALYLYPFRQSYFNEPFDGVVYAIMIGMGFATCENLLYAYKYGLETILLRAFTAVPAHSAFAVIMGYFVGKAKFAGKDQHKYLAFGLAVPVGIHGVYDFFILQEIYEGLMLLAVLVILICLYFAVKMVRELQNESPFREKEEETPSIVAKMDEEVEEVNPETENTSE